HLSKYERRSIKVDGERTVELDYGQMALRLLYAQAGVQAPPGDLYRIPSSHRRWKREGMKKVINALLSSETEKTRFPDGLKREFEPADKFREVRKAIEEHHQPIRHLLCKGAGVKLQALEAEIMIELLLTLKGKGITALPIHDCVLVPYSRAEEAMATMLSLFKERTGIEGVVRPSS